MLIFFYSAIFRGKQFVKVGPEEQILGPFLSHENLNHSNFFQTMFLLARVLSLVRISPILGNILGSKDPKTPKKAHFMDAESVRKTLKTFNWTTNAILIKLTTIIYLRESVNWKLLESKIQFFIVMSTKFQTALKTTTYVMH